MIDCGTPLFPTGGITEPFNSTKFGASITHHCQVSIRSVCERNGWYPDPASTRCNYYCEYFTFNSLRSTSIIMNYCNNIIIIISSCSS